LADPGFRERVITAASSMLQTVKRMAMIDAEGAHRYLERVAFGDVTVREMKGALAGLRRSTPPGASSKIPLSRAPHREDRAVETISADTSEASTPARQPEPNAPAVRLVLAGGEVRLST
jgi:hypothetical protein